MLPCEYWLNMVLVFCTWPIPNCMQPAQPKKYCLCVIDCLNGLLCYPISVALSDYTYLFFSCPPDGILVHCRNTAKSIFVGTHLYLRVSVFPRTQHNDPGWGLKPGPFNPKFSGGALHLPTVPPSFLLYYRLFWQIFVK